MEELRGLNHLGGLLGAGESLHAATRVRRVGGLSSPLRVHDSIYKRALDLPRQAKRSKVVIVTGQRVLICRRSLWIGKPKTVLLERPIRDFTDVALVTFTGPTEDAFFHLATKQGALLHLRNGGTWEMQVFGETAEGVRHLRWDELRNFVCELNRLK